jgi:hypothetical protein
VHLDLPSAAADVAGALAFAAAAILIAEIGTRLAKRGSCLAGRQLGSMLTRGRACDQRECAAWLLLTRAAASSRARGPRAGRDLDQELLERGLADFQNV